MEVVSAAPLGSQFTPSYIWAPEIRPFVLIPLYRAISTLTIRANNNTNNFILKG